MTSNLRILAPNALDLATLTDSPAMVATLPVTHLQDRSRARVARSVGLPSPQYIRGTWSASQAVNGCVIWRHNLTGAATVRLKLWAGADQTGTLLKDSGAIELGDIIQWGEFVWGVDTWGAWLFQDWPVACLQMWFDQVSALSFELQIEDAANTDGYMEASRVYLGKYFSPADGMSRGHKLRWEDDSTQERTDGGTLHTDAREPYRVLRIPLDWLTESERGALAEILRAAGKSSDLFVAMYPDDTGTKGRDYSAAVKLVDMPDIAHRHPLIYGAELVFAET